MQSHTVARPTFPVTPWERWLSNSSYTPQIRTYIEAQGQIFREVVLRRRYEKIIELGCGDGTLLMPTVISLDSSYLGVDISPRAIREAKKNLANAKSNHSYAGDARLIVADVCSLSSLHVARLAEPKKTLVALPFNLIGIIPCVEDLIRALHSYRSDILIFSYNTSRQANHARADYYRKCGFQNIQRVNVKGTGILFTDHKELFSYAYYVGALKKMLKGAGFAEITTIPFNNIGLAYYCTNQSRGNPHSKPPRKRQSERRKR